MHAQSGLIVWPERDVAEDGHASERIPANADERKKTVGAIFPLKTARHKTVAAVGE